MIKRLGIWTMAWAATTVLGLTWMTSGTAAAGDEKDRPGAARTGQESKDQPGGAPAPSAQAKDSKLPLCPVMDEPVDFTVMTMTDDGPVYFCCESCIKKLQKDPAKYASKVAAQRAALARLERIQVRCPVSDHEIDGQTKAEIDGQTIYFCCEDCIPKYKASPARYKARLEASYTYQTRCPVSGKRISPTAYVDLKTGQRIYLCCDDCGDKLLAQPEKYAPKLAEQGIRLDLKKLKGGE